MRHIFLRGSKYPRFKVSGPKSYPYWLLGPGSLNTSYLDPWGSWIRPCWALRLAPFGHLPASRWPLPEAKKKDKDKKKKADKKKKDKKTLGRTST